jgi:hypothetical protein
MTLELLKSGTMFRHASPYVVSSYVRQHVGTHAISVRRNTDRRRFAHARSAPNPRGAA